MQDKRLKKNYKSKPNSVENFGLFLETIFFCIKTFGFKNFVAKN